MSLLSSICILILIIALGIGLGLVIAFLCILGIVGCLVDDEPAVKPQEPPFHPNCRSMIWEKAIEDCAKSYQFDFDITNTGNMTVKKKKWSKKFSRCQGCGTKDRPCHGRGYCHRCYSRRYKKGLLTF